MSVVARVKSALVPDLAHIIELQGRFQDLIVRAGANAEEIAAFLDSLDHAGRVACVRSLCGASLHRLYDLVDGFRKVGIDDVVPPKVGALQEVRHYGKNSLPAFTIFEKRFLRPEKGAKELWGYNFQALSPITGPGYFVAANAPDRGEVDVDYTRLPTFRPEGWPPVVPNEKGLSTLVYAHMVDKLRGITAQVSIGRAWKKGKVQKAWFILCRE